LRRKAAILNLKNAVGFVTRFSMGGPSQNVPENTKIWCFRRGRLDNRIGLTD